MKKILDKYGMSLYFHLVKRLNQLEPADWAEATAGYRIERR